MALKISNTSHKTSGVIRVYKNGSLVVEKHMTTTNPLNYLRRYPTGNHALDLISLCINAGISKNWIVEQLKPKTKKTSKV